jgi:GntR family transcriptional regulator
MEFTPTAEGDESILLPMVAARKSATRRLRDLLRTAVIEASLAGEPARLPDERELMIEFDAPRDMVRDALALLAEEGILVRRPGVGTVSTTEIAALDLALPPTGLTVQSFLGSPAISPRVLSWHWIQAPRVIASRLDRVSVGDDVLCIDYLALADGRPVGTITNYMRSAEGQTLQPTDFVDDFYALLDHGRVDLDSHDFLIQPSSADRLVAELLGITVGDAIQRFEQLLRNSGGDVIDFATGAFRREVRIEARDVHRRATAHPPTGLSSSAQNQGVMTP